RDRAERVVVGDHAEDDVARLGHGAWRGAKLQAGIDQRAGLRGRPVVADHRELRVEEPAGETAAHRTETHEPERGHPRASAASSVFFKFSMTRTACSRMVAGRSNSSSRWGWLWYTAAAVSPERNSRLPRRTTIAGA